MLDQITEMFVLGFCFVGLVAYIIMDYRDHQLQVRWREIQLLRLRKREQEFNAQMHEVLPPPAPHPKRTTRP